MKLSLTERLTLANQFRLLSHFDKANAATFKQFESIVIEGYERNYPDLVRGINKRGVSADDCEFVIRVLEMYERIQQAFKDVGTPPPETAAFAGFDARNEGDLMNYAEFLVTQQGQFTGLVRTPTWNAGRKVSSEYRTRLQAFKKFGRDALSIEQAEALLAV